MTELDVGQLRVPPHSIEAEQSVLGGLLLDNSAWDRAGDLLTDSDFYRWEHRHIYAAIGALINTTRPADVITVFEQLQSHGKAEECGGLVYLNALAQSVPSAANLRRYAEIVRERAVQRAAIATLDRTVAAMWDAAGAEAALDQAANAIAGLQRRQVRHVPIELGAVLVQRVDHIGALAAGDATPAWPTGLAWLDETVLVRPGTLMILAARPSTGKSAFGLELARRWAESGLTTLFASLEMSREQLADRYIAAQGRIDHHAVQTGRLGDDAWGRLSDAVGRGSRLPLHLDDESGIGIAQLRAKARAVPSVRLVIVDYLQLMSGGPGAKGETRNAELERVSRGLKTLAKDLGCAVLALSQLNRAVEARSDKRPTMGDIRDSGAIEQDADVIAGLWRVRSFDSGKQVIGLNVMKNRAGRLGEVGFRFDGPTQRWTEDPELDLRPARASAPAHGGGFE